MNQKTLGIHHITAIASKPQQNYDFYAKVLGLRLVKRSVNQDQTEAYHLFFGDKTGEPGMDLTFFTFDPILQGARGPGQVTQISLAVSEDALNFWLERIKLKNIKHETPETRFGLKRVTFYDPDGQKLELVAVTQDAFGEASGELWETKEVKKDKAIGYFYSAQLSVISMPVMEMIVTNLLGFVKVDQEGSIDLYQLPNQSRGAYLEINQDPNHNAAINAAGTVHHIAFQVEDEKHLESMRKEIIEMGLYPTEVIDRFYFKSVYFRTPAGILFELATNGPGFTVDEKQETLGQTLKLPPWLEEQREKIVSQLEPIEM